MPPLEHFLVTSSLFWVTPSAPSEFVGEFPSLGVLPLLWKLNLQVPFLGGGECGSIKDSVGRGNIMVLIDLFPPVDIADVLDSE